MNAFIGALISIRGAIFAALVAVFGFFGFNSLEDTPTSPDNKDTTPPVIATGHVDVSVTCEVDCDQSHGEESLDIE
jgi:hypothetical protein